MIRKDIVPIGKVALERFKALLGEKNKNKHESIDSQHRGIIIALCFTCSVLLWGFSSMSETYTKVIDLSVEVENVVPDEAFITLPPEEIQIQVYGEGLKLLQLYYNSPRISINATQEQINLIEAVAQRLPDGIHIDRVTPPLFVLQKEAKISKKVPILLNVDIQTPNTHEIVVKPAVFPDSVEITGASSIVLDIQGWPTNRYTQHDLKDTLNINLPLVDSLQGLIDISVDEVVLYSIAEQFTEGQRNIGVLVRDVPSFQDSITLEPPVLEVRYRVPLSQYRRALSARDFILSVSYDDIRDDTTGYIEPVLELPENILFRDVSVSPDKIRYYDVLLNE